MAAVVDIPCPACGLAEPVRKIAIGEYRCADCGRTFTPEDVTPRG